MVVSRRLLRKAATSATSNRSAPGRSHTFILDQEPRTHGAMLLGRGGFPPCPSPTLAWLVVSGHGLASLWAAPRRTRSLVRLRWLVSCRRSSARPHRGPGVGCMLPPTPSRPSPAPLVRAPFPLEASFGPLTHPASCAACCCSTRTRTRRRGSRRRGASSGATGSPPALCQRATLRSPRSHACATSLTTRRLRSTTCGRARRMQHGQGVSSIPVFGGHRVRHRSRVRHLAG